MGLSLLLIPLRFFNKTTIEGYGFEIDRAEVACAGVNCHRISDLIRSSLKGQAPNATTRGAASKIGNFQLTVSTIKVGKTSKFETTKSKKVSS